MCDNYRRLAASAYLASEQFKPFKPESFAQLFTRAVAEDSGVELRHVLTGQAA
jgi:hypothetical protein